MITSKKIAAAIDSSVRGHVLEAGFRKVVATVSGGPDSIAMMAALIASGIEVTAAHCNFHLRGDESMRDQHHVEEICTRLGVDLLVRDFDIDSYMKSHKGTSLEMACRETRHAWFASLLTELNADRIATGHNADDNTETFFLNLLRGSGTSGLKAMLPDTGKIWRPLLAFHRCDIIEYLSYKNLPYVTDSTNLASDYRRNFLRNDVIPLLRSRWPGFDKALDRSIALIREENNVVAETVNSRLPDGDGAPLRSDTIMEFPAPELLVRRFIEPAGPFTTTAAEIISAIKADKPDKKIWTLRNGTAVLRNHMLHISVGRKPGH